MFVKPISVPNRKTGKRYTYYRLCESYRLGNAVRHRAILNLGKLEGLPNRADHKLLADRIEQIVYKRPSLFVLQIPEKVENLAQHFASIIINKGLLDIPNGTPVRSNGEDERDHDYQEVDVNSLEHNNAREIGAEWLCKQALDELGLGRYLGELSWKERWIKMAMIYITARAVFPASERKTEDWLRINSGLSELYGIEPEGISRHHLYKVSKMLYRNKEEIEKWMARRMGEIFAPEDKIILYDLTNLYFEGEKKDSEKARFGRSKERRNDARLMALGLVIDTMGFIRYSHIYAGNIKDSETLKQTITDMEGRYSTKGHRPVIVIDAGIATEENLKMLRGEKREYVCVSLAKMKECQIEEIEEEGKRLTDRKGNEIFARWVEAEGYEDSVLYVKSKQKELKERSMEEKFSKRYEEGLKAIKQGIERKGGIKRIEKVYERLGRLKERYPSVNRMYKVKIKAKDGIATGIEWERVEEVKVPGAYFIRTTLKGKDEETIWKIYNTLREIEATFRVLKSDLKMRPVFHQEDLYSEAHIYGSILAYMVVNTIRNKLKTKGIRDDWSNIVRTMNTHKVITSEMKTRTGRTIYIKKCSKPIIRVREIYQALNYKEYPFWQKKSVLPKREKSKNETLDTS